MADYDVKDPKNSPYYEPGDEFRPWADLEAKYSKASAAAAAANKKSGESVYPYTPGLNLWDQPAGIPVKGGVTQDPRQLTSYFNNPVPIGVGGFTAGHNYGKQQVADIYGSRDAKGIWNRLKDESEKGIDAASLKSIKDKYGTQGVLEQAKIQKAGLKGQSALRASEDIAAQKRQEMAAMDAAIKKESFNAMRDEWGRRTLLSANLPIAYGQLGSAASLGQVIQNLAGSEIKV